MSRLIGQPQKQSSIRVAVFNVSFKLPQVVKGLLAIVRCGTVSELELDPQQPFLNPGRLSGRDTTTIVGSSVRSATSRQPSVMPAATVQRPRHWPGPGTGRVPTNRVSMKPGAVHFRRFRSDEVHSLTHRRRRSRGRMDDKPVRRLGIHILYNWRSRRENIRGRDPRDRIPMVTRGRDCRSASQWTSSLVR